MSSGCSDWATTTTTTTTGNETESLMDLRSCCFDLTCRCADGSTFGRSQPSSTVSPASSTPSYHSNPHSLPISPRSSHASPSPSPSSLSSPVQYRHFDQHSSNHSRSSSSNPVEIVVDPLDSAPSTSTPAAPIPTIMAPSQIPASSDPDAQNAFRPTCRNDHLIGPFGSEMIHGRFDNNDEFLNPSPSSIPHRLESPLTTSNRFDQDGNDAGRFRPWGRERCQERRRLESFLGTTRARCTRQQDNLVRQRRRHLGEGQGMGIGIGMGTGLVGLSNWENTTRRVSRESASASCDLNPNAKRNVDSVSTSPDSNAFSSQTSHSNFPATSASAAASSSRIIQNREALATPTAAAPNPQLSRTRLEQGRRDRSLAVSFSNGESPAGNEMETEGVRFSHANRAGRSTTTGYIGSSSSPRARSPTSSRAIAVSTSTSTVPDTSSLVRSEERSVSNEAPRRSRLNMSIDNSFDERSPSQASGSTSGSILRAGLPDILSPSTCPDMNMNPPVPPRRPGTLGRAGRLRGPSRRANAEWLGLELDASSTRDSETISGVRPPRSPSSSPSASNIDTTTSTRGEWRGSFRDRVDPELSDLSSSPPLRPHPHLPFSLNFGEANSGQRRGGTSNQREALLAEFEGGEANDTSGRTEQFPAAIPIETAPDALAGLNIGENSDPVQAAYEAFERNFEALQSFDDLYRGLEGERIREEMSSVRSALRDFIRDYMTSKRRCPQILSNLPRYSYRDWKGRSMSRSASTEGKGEEKAFEKDKNCPICLDEYVDSDSLLSLGCRHAFHELCLSTWLEIQLTCPMCRCLVDSEPILPELL